MTRYLALVRGSKGADDRLLTRVKTAIDHHGLGDHICSIHGGLILTIGNCSVSLGRHGAVVGSLFRRGETKVVHTLVESMQACIVRTEGSELIDEYWGDYVAVITRNDGEEATILRSPFGDLPCLFTEMAGWMLVASDVDLLARLAGFHPQVDWTAACQHLALRDIRLRPTCLAGLNELHGGERLRLRGGWSVDEAWSPWRFADPDLQITERDEAVACLRTETLRTVRAKASRFRRIVLMLSGGLDSSIVAASLADSEQHFHCLTLVTRDRLGDEYGYAKDASDAVERPLHMSMREVSRIDMRMSVAARLPRPVARAFAQESRRAALELTGKIGADAIFGGGGGDNLFCSLQSGAPAADRLIAAGPGRHFLETARNISVVAPASMGAVIGDAVRRAWLGKRGAIRPGDQSYLSAGAIEAAMDAPIHPWLSPPSGTLPGKAGHARLLAYAQSYAESFDPRDACSTVAPLLAQPLVELCLRIPTWLWFEKGINRSVARDAFTAHLPLEITHRRSKGSPESFIAEIYDYHRSTICDLLLDGLLMQNAVIDRHQVERTLSDVRPAHGMAFHRIMELADVEAWARSWSCGAG